MLTKLEKVSRNAQIISHWINQTNLDQEKQEVVNNERRKNKSAGGYKKNHPTVNVTSDTSITNPLLSKNNFKSPRTTPLMSNLQFKDIFKKKQRYKREMASDRNESVASVL